MSDSIVRKALSTARDHFKEGSLEWENCHSALSRIETFLIDGKFIDRRSKRRVLGVLDDALEVVRETEMWFLVEDLEDQIEAVEAVEVAP